MKKYTFLLLILLGFINLYSQSPNKMSYQVVVTDNFDRLVQTRLINVKISILQSSAEGALVYSENHIVTTDYAGVADIEIGNGNKSNGSFADLDWSKGPYFIKTEIDPDGGSNYITKGISELLSVPYSLYSKTADKVLNASYNDLNDKPVGNNKGDILYWNGEGWTIIPIGTPGQWLQINQEGVPFWADAYQEDGSRSVPIVGTTPASSITSNTAVSGGYLRDACTYFGVCYNTSGNPTLYDTHTTQGNGSSTEGQFTTNLTNLQPNTTYYLKAYGTNSNQETGYGSQVTFTTLPGVPTVTTSPATNIGIYYAYTGGNVTSSGGAAVTSRGVCWNLTGNPTTADNVTSNGTGTGIFTSYIAGISNTRIYVRAYATNSIGTSYGNQITISTILPSVNTNNAASITCSSAILSNYVSTTGGTSLTECGVCYSTSSNPTMTTRTIHSPGVAGYNGSTVTSLLPNTTYYYKAYATNSSGTAYGTIKSFKTSAAGNPVVQTGEVSNIHATTAVCTGAVTTSNCSNIVARGICWSTHTIPTIADNKTTNGTGVGSFTASLSGLSLNETYYVRAYATTSTGTTIYGIESSFLTRLNIGDDWEGGKVFYIEDNIHGYVAAIADLSGPMIWSEANTACSELDQNGYTDWILPSLSQTELLHENYTLVGNFNNSSYWTSTSVDATFAKQFSHLSGFSWDEFKTLSAYVRPIRAF